MSAVPFGETRLPDGRISAYACAAGIRHRGARCERDVGPHVVTRGVHLVLSDNSLHHAVIQLSEAAWYADRVDQFQAKREGVDGQSRVRVKRVGGRPVTAPEADAAFSARVALEVIGLAEERDKAQGRSPRVREIPPAPTPIDLRPFVDQKGAVTGR